MAIRLWQGAVKQTTTGFRGPLMVQSRTASISFNRIIFLFLFSLLCLSGCGGGGTSGGVSSSYAGEYDGQLTLTVEWECYMAWPRKIFNVEKWCFWSDKKWCDWFFYCDYDDVVSD